MAKQHKSTNRPAQSLGKMSPSANKPAVSIEKEQKLLSTYSLWFYPLVLFVISIFIYSNTFQHRFVLDDHGIIKNNKITKAPISWENIKTIFSTPLRKGDFSDLENSLYRPFVKLLFNVEWNLFDGDPHTFHLINVILYGFTGVFMFLVLYDALNRRWLLPFLATLLFVTHPIHTEVVANIKSGDEILSLLGILIALRCIQLFISNEKLHYFVLAILAYLMASFSKESTVVAIAIIPLFIYYFTKASIKKNALISLSMLACTIFFLLCRHLSLRGYPEGAPVSALDNYLVLCKDPAYAGTSSFASAVNTLGLYLKTFIYPHPLSCDYSYSTMVPVGFGNIGFIISFLLFVAMFVFAIWKFKSKNAIGFGFLWFFISMSITSNVFFLIGTSFGERLFFIPSLGLCLSLVLLIAIFLHKEKSETNFMSTLKQSPLLILVVFVLAGLFSFKTMDRNTYWKTDYKLFAKDVENYPNSTHLLFYMGNHLSGSEFAENLELDITENNLNINLADSVKKANFRSIEMLSKSLSIYPALPSDGYNQLGKAYFNIGKTDSAQKYYLRAISEDSTNPIYTNNLGTTYYNSSIPLSQKYETFRSQGMMDSAQYYLYASTNKLLEALPYFQKAHKGDTLETDFINNLGCIYGATQRIDSALYWFHKAYSIDSLDLTAIQFLNITYRNAGKIQEADYFKSRFDMAKAIRRQQMK